MRLGRSSILNYFRRFKIEFCVGLEAVLLKFLPAKSQFPNIATRDRSFNHGAPLLKEGREEVFDEIYKMMGAFYFLDEACFELFQFFLITCF